MDDALVLSLVYGATIADAARSCQVTERTVYRCLQDDRFRARIQEARTLLVSQAAGELGFYHSRAANTFHALLVAERELVQLGATCAILELGHQGQREQPLLDPVLVEVEVKSGGTWAGA